MAKFMDHLADDVLPPMLDEHSREPTTIDGGTF
jgi:hypothetical protein